MRWPLVWQSLLAACFFLVAACELPGPDGQKSSDGTPDGGQDGGLIERHEPGPDGGPQSGSDGGSDLESYQVTVTFTGEGDVTSSPPGINCGFMTQCSA